MISAEQSREARKLLQLSQEELAEQAGLTIRTVIYFEGGRGRPTRATAATIKSALETAGVTFVASNGEGPGVRLKEKRKEEGGKTDRL